MPGLEGFSAGALHPLTAPAQLLIIVAFGLPTGQRPPPLDLKPLFIFFAPILAFALTLTATGVIRGVYQPILTGIALCAAIPVALEKPVSPLIYRVLTTAVALAIGFDSAPEPSSTGVLIKALAGTGIMVIFLVFDLAYYTRLAMGRPWLRVGVRVLGSWIIAISFLVLAFPCFHHPPKWPRKSAD
jgi:urease accessory protein